ncbi:MAG: undecaprenyl diphosphate synthase [Eubacteriales bacterium]|nr:undecaprenyl diphosphate synthase [Eubacteriales bacterium]
MITKLLNWLRMPRRKNRGVEALRKKIDPARLPVHVAIIMDGNGRWAARRGLPRSAGHRAGVESLRETVELCCELGIKYLTVYAFSTENWKRPAEEVNTLMNLLVEYLERELPRLQEQGVRLHPIGRLEDLPPHAREALAKAVAVTAANDRLILNLAINYGGRDEITRAARRIARDVCQGRVKIEEIDEQLVASYLDTAGQPDPDLLIRSSGEQRMSNFLLWQSAYTEFWLTPVFWPDFRRQHLLEAIVAYQQRQRRFGGLGNNQTEKN